MPHQCLHCNSVYNDDSEAILKGCPNCGRKLFLYIKEFPKDKEVQLGKEEKEFVESQVKSMMGEEKWDAPVVLTLENIKVIRRGKYELDINQLLKKEKPVIYKVQNGTYMIDLNFEDQK